MSLALLLSVAALPGQYGMPELLDPKTYQSRSGRFSLRINPSDPEGKGGAEYRLAEGGKPRWNGRLPFTLRNAVVTDDGRVAGYGNDGNRLDGVFIVAILDADGKTLHSKRHALTPSRSFHTPSDPKADGLILNGLQDRVIVRIDDPDSFGGRETWWQYDLSSGHPLPHIEFQGADAGTGFVVDAQGVPGTDLILVNRWRFAGQMGARFALVDRSGKAVWSLDKPGDYEFKGTEAAQDALREEMQRPGAILSVGPPANFQLRFVKEAKRVNFAVARQGNAWQVRETSCAPYVSSPPKPAVAPRRRQIPTIKLQATGRLVLLLQKRAASDIHDVEDFFWTKDNRLVVMRGGERPALVMADARGKALRTVTLPDLPKSKFKEGGPMWEAISRVLTWCGGDRFLVFQSRDGQAMAWQVDAKTGRMRNLKDFRSPSVDAAAGAPDGTFAVLATESSRDSMTEGLARFDANGRRLWEIREHGYGGEPKELLSPKDVAIDAQGRIVVLDVIQNILQYFDRSGKYLQQVAITPKTSYPTHVTFDSRGGIFVYDFGSEKPLLTLRADGRRTRAIALRDTGGKQITLYSGHRLDAQGRLWATDRASLYRYDATGRPDRVVGLAPLDRGLSQVFDLTVGADGMVYAIDAQSGDVAAFEPNGKRRFITRPLPKDFEQRPKFAKLHLTKSGDLYVRGTDGDGLLKFSSTGRRLGYVPDKDERGSPLRQPAKPDWHWQGANLIDGRGKVMATLDRWPNEDWMLGGPSAVAPNGSLFSVSGPFRRPTAPARMAWFSASGTPQGMASVPAEVRESDDVAYDGRLAYFVAKDILVAVDRKGRPVWRHHLPGKDLVWKVFPSRGGVALFDGVKTVTWYTVPK